MRKERENIIAEHAAAQTSHQGDAQRVRCLARENDHLHLKIKGKKCIVLAIVILLLLFDLQHLHSLFDSNYLINYTIYYIIIYMIHYITLPENIY